jgi:uncharacterized repeat protein (TIGR03803 family)
MLQETFNFESEGYMKTTVQPSCKRSGLRRRAVCAALALAAMLLPAVLATQPAQAQTFTTLANIGPLNPSGDAIPGVVQDAAGNLYGTTPDGGITGGACGQFGCGTVFKVDTTGTVTALYKFTGGADGQSPSAGLVVDAAGNLYGDSGANGAVFKLDTSGTFTVLHSPGSGSSADMILDAAGNLYGTTQAGGITGGACGQFGCGTVFKLDKSGTYTVLYSFTGAPDGAIPVAGVVLDAAGNLYGTTESGGVTAGTCASSGCGTVFKLDVSKSFAETVFYKFTGAPDGATPKAGVVLDSAGNLYGTTSSGGLLKCWERATVEQLPSKQQIYCGVVFKVDTTGTETVLHSFTGIPDGASPLASLVLDPAGNLYGTTVEGGSNGFFGCEIILPAPAPAQPTGCGSIFKLDPSGTVSVVYSFSGNEDGGYPEAGLVLDAAGNLYGSAIFAVFKLDPLGPANFDLTAVPQGKGSGTLAVNGTVCPGSACSEFFTKGTSVTLTATAAAGSSFAGWSAPCSGTGACNLTINSAELVFATFNLGAPDFSLSASALTPATVSPRGSSTSTLNVVPVGGFSGSVVFTCVVTPAPALVPTCSISPSSVIPGTPATLTVSTTGPTAGVVRPSAGSGLFYALCLPLIGLVVTGVGLGSKQKNRKRNLTAAALTCMLIAGLLFQVACGGSSSSHGSSGTPLGPYTITVKGTDATGALVHTTTTKLTVQ